MVEQDQKPLVTITGVTGFLGAWVAKYYLEAGTYRIRGTVRSTSNATKMDPLKATLGEELFSQMELVEADLLDATSLSNAITGSTFVVHTASPFVLNNPEDPQTLIKPAVEGTTAVLQACKANGVQRLVITSSIAAVRSVRPENWPADNTFNESHWSDPAEDNPSCSTYNRSKTLAEKAAWNFRDALPESEKFDIVVLNPALIMGPAKQTNDFASGTIIRGMMTSGAANGRLKMGQVDVRDVAKAHLLAVTQQAAANRRFILVSRCAWRREMAECLAAEFNSQGFAINTTEATDDQILDYNVDTTASREILGLEYMPLEQSWKEMAQSLIESGFIQRPQ